MTKGLAGDAATGDVTSRAPPPAIRVAAVGLFAVGALERLVPLFQGDLVLFRQPTEDGYLLLTVARNMALGNGMSTHGGEIPTNGVQPLITFLFAIGYALVGGDKLEGVRVAMLISALIACAGALLACRFAKLLFEGSVWQRSAALIASGLWFACPTFAKNTSNGLETGLYCLAAFAVWLYLAKAHREGFLMRHALVLGLLLGLAFWARNDAVFLIAVTCLTIVFGPGELERGTRWARALVAGVVASIVALPWVSFNVLRFGHPVPVSGQSEALDARFAANLIYAPAKLLEYLSVVVAIPDRFERNPFVVALGCAAAVGVGFATRIAFRRGSIAQRALIAVTAGLATCFTLYYGLFFGAEYFMARYLMPVSFPLMLVAVGVTCTLLERRKGHAFAHFARAGVAVLVAAPLCFLVLKQYKARTDHMHFQVVDWVTANTRPETIVAAVQTGTLGYFHDRTINLDGKVNPYALRLRQMAARDPGRRDYVLEYVRSSPIEYVADWWGVGKWEKKLRPDFELLISEEAKNLAVLKRVKRP